MALVLPGLSPVSSVRLELPNAKRTQPAQGHPTSEGSGIATDKSNAPAGATAMDFLASAAEAAQGNAQPALAHERASSQSAQVEAGTLRRDETATFDASSYPNNDATFWNASTFDSLPTDSTAPETPASGHAGLVDASIYNACIPFDLEAFLKDVDQLF